MGTINNKDKNYRQEVIVRSSPEGVYEALTIHIDKWWSTVDQSAQKEGDIFKITFTGQSYWRFKVLESSEQGKVIWECIESNQDHNINGMDEEWLGSKLYWDFVKNSHGVLVKFYHKGLSQGGVCYQACSTAWDFYITESLKNYLESGIGQPNER